MLPTATLLICSLAMNGETYQGKMPLTALSPTEHARQYLIRRESLKFRYFLIVQIHFPPSHFCIQQ